MFCRTIFSFLVLIFWAPHSELAFAIDIKNAQLPLEYQCRQTATSAIQYDDFSRKWKPLNSQGENFSFILQIYAFSQKATHPKCELAVIASGKVKDKFSESKRTAQTDVCVIKEVVQREKYGLTGPIIKYCSTDGPGNSRLLCQQQDFIFDSRSLAYMEYSPLGSVFEGLGALILAGICTRN